MTTKTLKAIIAIIENDLNILEIISIDKEKTYVITKRRSLVEIDHLTGTILSLKQNIKSKGEAKEWLNLRETL